MKLKFEGKNYALQISAHQCLWGGIFDRIQVVAVFLSFCSEIEKENQNVFISSSTNLSGIFG